MSPATLSRFANGRGAESITIGTEMELTFPIAGDQTTYPLDREIPDTNDYRVIRLFFNNSHMREIRHNISEFERNYRIWKEDMVDDKLDNDKEFVASKVRERIPNVKPENIEYYGQLLRGQMAALLEEHGEFTVRKYISSLLDGELSPLMSDIAHLCNFQWPFGTSNETAGEDSLLNLAATFRETFGVNCRIFNSYHETTKQTGIWYFEPDRSIQPDDNYFGIELVSPPMPAKEGLNIIPKVLNWARQHGAMTNESTGMHVGVSIPDHSSVNFVKLVLLLGDDMVLSQFGRLANSNCESTIEKLKRSMRYDMLNRAVLQSMKSGIAASAVEALSKMHVGRGVSVNFKETYVEFRSMGNDYLASDDILPTMHRFMKAYSLASDPNAAKAEYYKKLAKLFPNKSDAIQYFVEFSAGMLTSEQLIDEIKTLQWSRQRRK